MLVSGSEYNVYIKSLVKDIDSYMNYLTVNQGLKVSIHRLDTLINSFQENLLAYNCHLIPYCQCMKRDKRAYHECCIRQIKLFSIIGEVPFFGTCWAGVGEFVFPIPNRYSEGNGFISVSGYKGDRIKAKLQMLKISRKYDISHSELQTLYAGLKDEHPPLEELTALIKPLVHMLELLMTYLYDATVRFPEENASSSHLFTSICVLVRNEFNVHYSLTDLAERFNCSVSHISHLFSKHAGCTYVTYINNLRIGMAKLLLASTHMNVQEISDYLGYVNSNYFSTVFHRVSGMSPREYRASSTEKRIQA